MHYPKLDSILLKRLFKSAGPAYVNALAQAGTIGLHLVSGILVGGVMGFFIDEWLDSKPWGMIIMGIFGIIAGFKNMYIDSKKLVASQQDDQKNAKDSAPKD